jgi:hypothetical protein
MKPSLNPSPAQRKTANSAHPPEAMAVTAIAFALLLGIVHTAAVTSLPHGGAAVKAVRPSTIVVHCTRPESPDQPECICDESSDSFSDCYWLVMDLEGLFAHSLETSWKGSAAFDSVRLPAGFP